MDELERDYCPPLDPALVYALASDYDLTDPASLGEARTTLDQLKASAIEQEHSSFDASGTSSELHRRSGQEEEFPTHPESSTEADIWTARSEDTDTTGISNGVRSLGLSEASNSSESEYLGAVEQGDEEFKISNLQAMFPETKDYAIRHTLRKCNGRFGRAMDELLNHAFFDSASGAASEHERVYAKGIEAFSEDVAQRRGRKPGRKKKAKPFGVDDVQRASSLPATVTPLSAAKNPWQTGEKDVEFITSRTGLSHHKVASLYHENGASLPATIAAVLNINDGANLEEEIVQAHVSELGRDFPSISAVQRQALIRLTHPSTASAHELARALTSSRPTTGGIQLIPRYAPVDTSDQLSNDEWTSVPNATRRTPAAMSSGTTSTPSAAAASHYDAGVRAIIQAQEAYRRGRSDRLMGGAAAYYSQIGRDHFAASHEASSEAADELVKSQSSPTCIDLHGVTVQDAVRIARERTETWYRRGRGIRGLDGRMERGSHDATLEIVTGVGHHSRHGRAMIGPAVGRMLAREGWAARVEGGVLVVTGRQR